MQIKLNNSKLILLFPEGYERVENADDLYGEMYHKRQCRDLQMYYNVAGLSYSNVTVCHIDPKDAMTFGSKAELIQEIHNNLGDNQGLIEVETGTNPRGYEYIYSIIKTYHQDVLNVNYCLRMNIQYGTEIIEVVGSYFESHTTGVRSAMGWNMAMSAGLEQDEASPHRIKGWAQDPYDPNYTKGCRMILCERRGLDGFFSSDPLSQARELVLALTEDSYYKTEEEMKEARDKKEREEKKKKRSSKKNTKDEEQQSQKSEEKADTNPNEWLQVAFGNDAIRSGAYKVDIIEETVKGDKRISINPIEVAKAASEATGKAAQGVKKAVAKTAGEFEKVKTPFEVPDEFRTKLNRPMPKELPGWGKRKYIGFGKGTAFMSGICLSWPVTEEESLPLTDSEGLVRQYHEDMEDHQGLIDAKCGLTPKGNRYAYSIRKMYFKDEEGNPVGKTDYELNLNIRIDGQIQFINGSFRDREDIPGGRDGLLELMTLGSNELKLGTEKWNRDPFDSNYKKGFLMNWKEDGKYDALFPHNALSELRQFVRYVIENN